MLSRLALGQKARIPRRRPYRGNWRRTRRARLLARFAPAAGLRRIRFLGLESRILFDSRGTRDRRPADRIRLVPLGARAVGVQPGHRTRPAIASGLLGEY